MIIVRSPLRVTLGGGGTDLPSYYASHGGLCLAAAIDKYVYITLHETFVDDLIVKYSRLERVKSAADLEHPIVREALGMLRMDGKSLEIASHADVPAGTGLGSSGSFTCALLRALHAHEHRAVSPGELAEQACIIEMDRLGEPVGKQDQHMASYGGVQSMTFSPDGVQVLPVPMTDATRYALEDNLLLFFTGYTRSASYVRQDDRQPVHVLDEMKDLAIATMQALSRGELQEFARLQAAQWDHKRHRSARTTNEQIDAWYSLGMQNGAMGGKLVGAGGGGFLMFYAEEKTKLRQAMADAGLRELRFRFDYDGARVVAA